MVVLSLSPFSIDLASLVRLSAWMKIVQLIDISGFLAGSEVKKYGSLNAGLCKCRSFLMRLNGSFICYQWTRTSHSNGSRSM